MLRIWLLTAIAKALFLCVAAGAPNVIIIVADDVGWSHLGSEEGDEEDAPVLQGLREESTAFEQLFVSPTGAASRAALITGRHEFAVGVSHGFVGRNLLRPGVPTMPELMRDAGYSTGIFGLWQLGDAFPCRPEDRGFEEILVHGGAGIGAVPDAWGNVRTAPLLRSGAGWVETEGGAAEVVFERATKWLNEEVEKGKSFFLWLAPEMSADSGERLSELEANLKGLLRTLEEREVADETIVVFVSDGGGGSVGIGGIADDGTVRVPCFVRWPGKIAPGRKVDALAAHFDLMPTVASLCGVAMPAQWRGDGMDLSAALKSESEFPKERTLFFHAGGWPGDESPARHRTRGFSVRTPKWRLVGLELFDMENDPEQRENLFPGPDGMASRLLVDYGRWWDSVQPSLMSPVRYRVGDDRCPVVDLTCADWWPSLEAETGTHVEFRGQAQIRAYLDKSRVAKTRNALPGASGHWKLDVAREGRYRVRMSLLPKSAPDDERRRIGLLRSGTAHVRVAKREVQLEVVERASSVAMEIDLDAGPADLEAWFGGQLPADRKIGAFFASIERVGDRKEVLPELEVKPVEGSGQE
ncbi:N-acetylgalactosamine-6-sulfatase [Haloferula helveola]|uniref:N-acetylgalactosamine-6-sulfatase n=1 Tax=Haloferula helveola TaxID=490095 RepID=A0ABM7RIY3_9BACT|nr:N-acetylgalactosamine-6-sulfatase [Haloferula helveola]